MPFSKQDGLKMFQRLGAIGALIALVLVILIETGVATDRNLDLCNFGLTAMIVVLAVSLVGSIICKR